VAGHGAAADPGAGDAAHGQPQAHGPPAGDHAQGAEHGASSHEEAESIWSIPARIFNFALLAGGLIYLLRSPLADYLASRKQQIRGGLDAARETSEKATAQLAELDRRLQALPAELEALRRKGVEEIAAEERRIQAKAEAERTRLIEDMRRDVDVRVRVARKALAEHTADLAVGLAADRVRQTITEADQARLIDRYTDQVKDIHG
jgi:F0F1-type ATP synthase membrane subunit b/b'